MDLVVWNSQGNKWDIFWTYYFGPLVTPSPTTDVVGMLVESGWAPWVAPGDVIINGIYPLNTGATWASAVGVANSAFCQGVLAARGRHAFWVPWVGNLNAFKTNTRCSLGGAFVPKTRQFQNMSLFNEQNIFRRPVVQLSVGIGNNTDFTIMLVHLISGNYNKAQDEMDYLVATMSHIIPQGTTGIVVGDMNIDLLKTPVVLPQKWRMLNTGVATQQSGGELDYALLYDPNGLYSNATAAVVQQYKTGNNGSDHSVMKYSVPI
jgi:hypothetical protein